MSKATLLDSRIKQYAYRETAQIYRDIGASPDGLSTDQVEIMREKYGTNSFAGRRDDTLLRRLRRLSTPSTSLSLSSASFRW